MRGIVRLALSLGVLVALGVPALADETAGRIAAFDGLVRLGKPVKLRAKLEGKGMLGVYSSVEGESLDFWLTAEPAAGGKPGVATLEAEKFLGGGKTDSSGIGELEWTPEAVGSYEIEARVRKGSKYVAIPAALDVLCAAHERPITLVTIEQTLTDVSSLSFMRKDAKDVTAAEGAAEALTKIADKNHVIYVTGIEEVSLVKTKEWLKLRGFPRGPVFFWNISTQAFSGEKYKTNLVAKLHNDFSGLTSGIGGKVEDVNACLKNGVTAYLMGSADSDAPAEAIRVKLWEKLPAALDRQQEVEKLLADLACDDPAKQEAAAKTFSKLETGELGYLNRFVHSSDVSVAAAARIVVGNVRARDAFSASLDASTDSAALASLLAAWRFGDPTVAARCYRDGASGLAKAGPALDRWRKIEVVNRTEPEPGHVVYRLRFQPQKDTGASGPEQDYTFLKGDDGNWRVDS
jgi:hypothetical protein